MFQTCGLYYGTPVKIEQEEDAPTIGETEKQPSTSQSHGDHSCSVQDTTSAATEGDGPAVYTIGETEEPAVCKIEVEETKLEQDTTSAETEGDSFKVRTLTPLQRRSLT
jgi:hypothetical protein